MPEPEQVVQAPGIAVDMVFTWVDGADPAHLRERRRFEAEYPVTDIRPGTRADRRLDVRYEQVGEITASVQSVIRHLAWVRTIYVITDAQMPPVPQHLLDSGRVRVVAHAQVVPAEYRPTFSSRVVESCLHRIPGLSEVFLYNNDDYMHFSPVPRGAFFDIAADGRVRLVLWAKQTAVQRALYMVSHGLPAAERVGSLHAIGIYHAYAMLRSGRGLAPREILVPRHSTQVIRRSTAERLEAEFGEALDANRRLKFRSVRGFSYATLLYTMEKVWNPDDIVHRALLQDRSRQFRMFDFGRHAPGARVDRLWRRVARSQVQFACLNNVPAAARTRFVDAMAQKGLWVPHDAQDARSREALPQRTTVPAGTRPLATPGPPPRRCLLISPYFPPMSRIGAKRPLHLCRHLPHFGWQPVVLAAPPRDGHVDPTLLDALPPGTVVSRGYEGTGRALARRAFGASPLPFEQELPAEVRGPRDCRLAGYGVEAMSPFDRYAFDMAAAVREAVRLVRQHDLQAIHVIADPWTAMLTASVVHHATGLPLVADLRDPWSLHEGKMARRPGPTRAAIRTLENLVFRRAARVVLNTSAACQAYQAAYADRIPGGKFIHVRNAFDPDLFAPGAREDGPAFRVVYYGRFSRFFTPEPLLAGFRRFVDREAAGPGQARLTLVGGLRSRDRASIGAFGLEAWTDCPGFVAYRESLAVLRAAHVLCLVVPPTCALQIPGKFYDYLAARRPVLALTDSTEIRDLLACTGSGTSASFGDADQVADRLAESYARYRRGESFDLEPALAAPFTAREQARAMAAVLDEVTP